MKAIDKRRLKTINAILYFANKVKHPSITKILKMLYFLDFEHFKIVGRPVTGLRYYAWKYGPVPRDLYEELNSSAPPTDIQDSMALIKDENEISGKKYHKLVPKKNPDLDVFTPRELKLMENIAEIFKEIKPTDTSQYTHDHEIPYKITWEEVGKNALIDYLLAIDEKSPLSKEEAKQRFEESEEFWKILQQE